jgi:hypothetical protein
VSPAWPMAMAPLSRPLWTDSLMTRCSYSGMNSRNFRSVIVKRRLGSCGRAFVPSSARRTSSGRWSFTCQVRIRGASNGRRPRIVRFLKPAARGPNPSRRNSTRCGRSPWIFPGSSSSLPTPCGMSEVDPGAVAAGALHRRSVVGRVETVVIRPGTVIFGRSGSRSVRPSNGSPTRDSRRSGRTRMPHVLAYASCVQFPKSETRLEATTVEQWLAQRVPGCFTHWPAPRAG